jgi:hypothetical protein
MPKLAYADAIQSWKRKNGIDSADESEYRYLLRDLGLIADRVSTDVDLFLPLGGDGPALNSFVPRFNIRLFFLTKTGEDLYERLISDRPSYEYALFWLIIRNQSYLRLMQQLFQNRLSFCADDIRELIRTNDSTSRNCAIQWMRYFSIAKSGNGCRLDTETLARLLLAAAIMEINTHFEQKETYYVKEIDRRLNETFSLTPSSTDFVAALDTIFHYADKSVIQGYPSGRADTSLPSQPNVAMVRFTGSISLGIAFQANPAEVLRITRYAV